MDQQPPEPPPATPEPPAAPPPASGPPAGVPSAAVPPPAWPAGVQATGPGGWQPDPAPAGPAPGVEFAPYGARLVAYIIDGLILGVVITALSVVLVGLLVASTGNDGEVGTAGGVTIAIWTGVIVVLSLLYFPYFWQKSGRTPGMSMFGLRVVRDGDGGPLSWGVAILRYIGFFVDSIVFGIPFGFLWVFVDKRRRAWHDLIGGTVVIKG